MSNANLREALRIRARCGLVVVTVLATVHLAAAARTALAGPGPCEPDGDVVNCTGNHIEGIASGDDFLSPPVTTLNVYDIDGEIHPAPGEEGIYFVNEDSASVRVQSGDDQVSVVIVTEGDDAVGIAAESRGTPTGSTNRPSLGLKIPTGTGGAGGPVQVESHSDITTGGDESHGIAAQNRVGGYDPQVIESLENFSLDGITLAVASVDGSEDNVGQVVVGDNGGNFTLRADGTFDFGLGSFFDSLPAGEEVTTRLSYQVSQSSAGGSDFSEGHLSVKVTRNEGGVLEWVSSVHFPEYDVHGEPSGAHPLWPDLQGYVDGLLADAGVAGAGESISVTSAGSIVTSGASSHGIFAQTESGRGSTGSSGTFWDAGKIPTAGGPGANGGAIDVENTGSIETTGETSSGVVVLSRGGTGGRGGNGGPWRYGASGGPGGDGGEITIVGSGSIHTQRDGSSGIVAVSEGGIGGNGGSGEGATGGGDGGYGGDAGAVTVDTMDESSTITTAGVDSHGIWAKSIGGAGGVGGTNGWLGTASGGAGGSASDGGSVTIISAGSIETGESDSHGIYAESVGGFGGDGGDASGLFVSWGGSGSSAGSGGSVAVTNQASGSIATHGDRAHAVLAQSIGGGGGSGGSGGAIVGLGGEAAAGGHGGEVSVTNDGQMETFGTSARGIYAQSIGGGGGDGGNSLGLAAVGGAGSETSDGGAVTVTNNSDATITTHGEESHAIFAESVGGGGGDGGSSGGWFSFGGSGAGGGDGGAVVVTNSGRLETSEAEASGIFAQSVGGGGGNGGSSVSLGLGVSLAIGGQGGGGGIGAEVDVTSNDDAEIITGGDSSHGIFAQSVGGGGGNGGYAVSVGGGQGNISMGLGIGGAGAGGGDGGAVEVNGGSPITTSGAGAHGVFAQSVGGGGGNGGLSVAGSTSSPVNISIGVGGSAGGGGSGSDVSVGTPGAEPEPFRGDIATSGDRAHGILAQSVGGGGGQGGFGVAASAQGMGINLAFGGSGGEGGGGGQVDVLSAGGIDTEGEQSYGILAQSIGGGGGSGGFSVSASASFSAAILLGFGGEGGVGGTGGDVAVDSTGDITTRGVESYAILAQSVGGGGGAGGFSIGAGVSTFGGLSFSMGGDGGDGNSGGAVDVQSSGHIETFDEFAHGILAQSVGGGGGTGGASTSVMASFIGAIPLPPEIPEISADLAIALGGEGGKGGEGGYVGVTNTGAITTHESYAYGVYAQSLGGGGGAGGKGVAATADISLPDGDPTPSVAVHFALAVGGAGGDGNHGGTVEILNEGGIDTSGEGSHGIFAQSVGGGGGTGGDARALTLSIDPMDWIPGSSPGLPAINISVGGEGGSGSDGGGVTVGNTGDILTRGADAFGILAQSIGGGGGNGGNGYHGLPDVPSWLDPILELTPIKAYGDLQIVVGGKGGSTGDGGDVSVSPTGDITTLGDGSIGVFAQSVGGGGGTGGDGAIGLVGKVGVGGGGGAAGDGGAITVDTSADIYTSGIAAHGIFAQSVGGGGGKGGNIDRGIGDFGIGLGIGQDGGSSGDGGAVSVTGAGDIVTRGAGANAIFAQSVGGGGGLAGGIETGFGFAGSAGGDGSGGEIDIIYEGNITTWGDVSHGIFAQSAGGQADAVTQRVMDINEDGTLKRVNGEIQWLPEIVLPDRQDLGSAIDIEITGDVVTHGKDSHGIFAQSVGDDGNGDISITILGGTVRGGWGASAGVRFEDGATNTLNNQGTVTSVDGVLGRAIIAGDGDETIENGGTVMGDVDLGGGSNAFNNGVGGTFRSGTIVALGADPTDLLTNAGVLTPGGTGNVLGTNLTGHLAQTNTGTFLWDLDVGLRQADRLDVSGTADLAGLADLNIIDLAVFHDGDSFDVLSADVIGSEFDVVGLPPDSALMRWSYDYLRDASPDIFRVQVAVDPFESVCRTRLQCEVAAYLEKVAPGASGDLAEVIGAFQLGVPESDLDTAFTSLSPDQYDGATLTGIETQRRALRGAARRMNAVRTRRLVGIEPEAMASIQLAMLGSGSEVLNIAGVLRSAAGDEREARNHIWADGFGQFGDQAGEDGFTGFDYDMGGGSVGIDRAFGERFVAGLNGGYSYTDVDFDSGRGDADIDAAHGSLYATWFDDRGYVEGVLSYARQEYDNDRHVMVGPIARTAHSEHDANVFGAQLGGGYRFDLAGFGLRPFLSLSYVLVDEESFRESGAGGANLSLDDRTTSSFVSELGLRVARAFETGVGTFVPHASAAWEYDFDIDDRTLRSGFTGAPGTAFSVDGRDVDLHGALTGAGVIFLRDEWTASLDYIGEFRGDYVANGVLARVGFAF